MELLLSKKNYKFSVLLLFILNEIMCGVYGNTSNVTKNIKLISEHDELLYSLRRLPRFLSFHAMDEDVKVDLEFAVPFIKVPVKRAQDAATSMTKSLANINISAIALTGLIVLLGISVGSIFSSLGGGNTWSGFKPFGLQKMADLLEPLKFSYKDSRGIKTESSIHDVVDGIESLFQSQDVDVTSCIQKTICFLVKSSSDQVFIGRGSSTGKIIDGLTSSKWLLSIIDGTAIKDAIDAAKSNRPCSHKYHYCKWTDSDISDFFSKFLKLF